MTTRFALGCAGAVAVALLLAACSPPPSEGAWLVSPVITNDTPFGDADITFIRGNLTDDTAGGVWAESGGSWLGVTADGVITRFDEHRQDGAGVLDAAALAPTLLYVLRPVGSGALNTAVELLDTATGLSEPVLAGQRVQTSPAATLPFTADGPVTTASPFGAIASIDVDGAGRLVFAERVDLPEQPFAGYVVRRMLPGGTVETLAGSAEPGSAAPSAEPANSPRESEQLRGKRLASASVEITAGDPRGVIVSTPEAVYQITSDGTARVIDGPLLPETNAPDLSAMSTGYPVRGVDAASDGSIVVGTAEHSGTPKPMHITGGSDRFRLLVRDSHDPHHLSTFVVTDGVITASEALDHAGEAVWVEPGVLVVSIPGSLGDAALARVELAPTRAKD